VLDAHAPASHSAGRAARRDPRPAADRVFTMIGARELPPRDALLRAGQCQTDLKIYSRRRQIRCREGEVAADPRPFGAGRARERGKDLAHSG
jgi:hypothetical protein